MTDGGTAHPTGGDAATGPIGGADRVIASLRGQFHECYQRGLQIDRELDGCVVLGAKVAPDGSVSTIEPISQDRLSPDVIACVASVVKDAHFDAPGGSGSTLNIPITFIQRQDLPPAQPASIR